MKALETAKDVRNLEEIGSKTQQMIVFLTDGEPTVGETSSYVIKENVKQANSDLNIPIYGLAFGDGADFNLVKDISDESNGFAQRIYESGNSFEQLEDFYTKISGTLKVCMPIIHKCKIPMFQRVGMREGGGPLPLAFQYLILMA